MAKRAELTGCTLLLLLLGNCRATSAAPQDNAVTQESSNASIRGNCGATPSSHGVCGPDGKLRCRAGWTGKLCDEPMCSADCNKQHGFCTKPGECICQMGWRGNRCDECIPLPGCQHGSCNGTSFTCNCHEGWSGPHCSEAVCREGCHMTRGYCDNPGECKCRIGWGGSTCDECAVVPGCQNGFCQKPLECRCRPGWTGNLCQTPICAEGCHPEHGTCKQPGECRCEVGWYGPQCSTCHPYPGCKNGHCTRPWECICDPGWTGMTCDKRIERISGYCDANSNACLNGGTCIDVLGPRNYTCSCPSLFTGMRCDYLADRRSKSSLSTGTTTTPPSKKAKSLPTKTMAITTSTLSTTSTTRRSTIFRRSKNTAAKSATTTESTITETEESDYNSDFEDYGEAPRGQHSLIHSVTASPQKFKQHKEQREIDAKNARRLFLQKQATITFRQPKIVPTIRTRSRPLKLPFTVIDRKHLSLPVFLPRVSDVIRKNITMSKNETQNDTVSEDEENKRPSSQTIGLLKNIRPGKRNRDDNSSSTSREILSKKKSSFFIVSSPTTEISTTQSTSTTSSINTTATILSSTVASNVSRRPEKIESTVSPIKISSGESFKNFESILDSPLPWKQDPFKSTIKGEQTIKDILEGYEKPQPVLVVDYDDTSNDENFNELQKANDNKISGTLKFLNQNRRYLEPESLNLASENSQESSSNGPSRPMFLVAVRPIPHPDGSVRPIGAGGNPLINFSHGNYPSATFLGESRSGKFLPHGRSVGSGRGPIHFSSPSFSVSNPSKFNFRHFAPQTRLSRRIGHASSVAPISQVFSEEDNSSPSDTSTSSSEKKIIHFYEEHLDGSVHIGVDRHTPQEEIINAFIEIKKARP
ncbi:EGF-like domain [Trinorchestia longiramus]|nr:EGF-like domain [Trinorchestia longiramus]